MKKKDKELLENLEAGKYDGVFNRSSFGGGDWSIRVEDGSPTKTKYYSQKFFNGKENERNSWNKVETFDTDDEKLYFLKHYGYNEAFLDFPEVREAAKEHRKGLKATVPIAVPQTKANTVQPINEPDDEDDYEYDSYNYDNSDNEDDSDVAASIAGLLLLAYGVYKAVPHVKRWWNDKAAPRLVNMKNKVFNKDKANSENEGD